MTDHPTLAAALAAFQAAAPKVHKGKTANVPTKSGGSYRYTYADLADVSAAALPALTSYGLSFTSYPRRVDGTRDYELVGELLHTSGESRSGALPIHGDSEQAMGSSLTYGRRYLLGCLTGLVTDDDPDGALAPQSPPQEPQETPTQTALRGIAQAKDAATVERVLEWAQANVPAEDAAQVSQAARDRAAQMVPAA